MKAGEEKVFTLMIKIKRGAHRYVDVQSSKKK